MHMCVCACVHVCACVCVRACVCLCVCVCVMLFVSQVVIEDILRIKDGHDIAGSILLMIMKMISVAFDMEATSVRPQKKPANQQPANQQPANQQPAIVKPTFLQYTCYCIMPGTTIFGPFISYQTHLGFLNPTPLVNINSCSQFLLLSLLLLPQTFSWLLKLVTSLVKAVVSVCMSVCIATFLFPEPYWNK